jgi:hypothetical protein
MPTTTEAEAIETLLREIAQIDRERMALSAEDAGLVCKRHAALTELYRLHVNSGTFVDDGTPGAIHAPSPARRARPTFPQRVLRPRRTRAADQSGMGRRDRRAVGGYAGEL